MRGPKSLTARDRELGPISRLGLVDLGVPIPSETGAVIGITDETVCDQDALAGEADTLTERLIDVRSRLQRLYEALETGRLGLDDLAPRIKELRDQERELTASSDVATRRASEQEVHLIDKEHLLAYLVDLRTLLSAGTPEQRKSFPASFIERVGRNGDEVEIEYELPLPSEHARLSGREVPPIDLNGGPVGLEPTTCGLQGMMSSLVAWE